MKLIGKTVAATALCLLAGGCATQQQAAYNVKVAAYAAPSFDPASKHRVWPVDSALENDKGFEDVAGQVTRAMEGAGLTTAAVYERPNVVVLVKYGADAPGPSKGRFLELTAYDADLFDTAKEARQAWQVRVVSDGAANLKSAMPYMISAAQPYLGKGANAEVRVTIPQGDKDAEFIRSGTRQGARKRG
jgi:hypothetical protein